MTMIPATPIAIAPTNAITARAISVERRSWVPSGRPCSSSSAWALIPTARKNAAGAAPEAGEVGLGAVEDLDVRPEEAPHLEPRGGDDSARQRQPDSGVHPPQGAQDRRARNAELDHPDPAARLDHAGELAHRRRAV